MHFIHKLIVFAQWQAFRDAKSMFDCAIYAYRNTHDRIWVYIRLGNFPVYMNTRESLKKKNGYSAIDKPDAISHTNVRICAIAYHMEYIKVTMSLYVDICIYLYPNIRIFIVKSLIFPRVIFIHVSTLENRIKKYFYEELNNQNSITHF